MIGIQRTWLCGLLGVICAGSGLSQGLELPSAKSAELQLTSGAGDTQLQTSIQVAASGAVRVERSSPTAKYAALTGQLSATERERFDAAVDAARLGKVPTPIAVPAAELNRPFRLTVDALAPLGGETQGQLGDYGNFPQVELVVDALLSVRDRLLAGPDSGLRAWVDVDEAGAIGLRYKRSRYAVSNPDRYGVLVSLHGTQVELHAEFDAEQGTVEIAELLSPRRLEGAFNVHVEGRLTYLEVEGERHPVVGPLSPALNSAHGQSVHVRGYAFYVDGAVHSIRVDRAQATVLEPTILREANGSLRRHLAPGDSLWVSWIHTRGLELAVLQGTRAPAMVRTQHVTFASSPASPATTSSAPTTGLTKAVTKD